MSDYPDNTPEVATGADQEAAFQGRGGAASTCSDRQVINGVFQLFKYNGNTMVKMEFCIPDLDSEEKKHEGPLRIKGGFCVYM